MLFNVYVSLLLADTLKSYSIKSYVKICQISWLEIFSSIASTRTVNRRSEVTISRTFWTVFGVHTECNHSVCSSPSTYSPPSRKSKAHEYFLSVHLFQQFMHFCRSFARFEAEFNVYSLIYNKNLISKFYYLFQGRPLVSKGRQSRLTCANKRPTKFKYYSILTFSGSRTVMSGLWKLMATD